jgi:predicted nucleotidyltransferase
MGGRKAQERRPRQGLFSYPLAAASLSFRAAAVCPKAKKSGSWADAEFNINGTILRLIALWYSARMKPSDALNAHRAELRELVSRHGLLVARVFGSVLSGTDTDESDLDLLVEPAEKTGLMALAAFKIEAERLLGVEVSVVTPNALPAKFRSEVLQQAKAL